MRVSRCEDCQATGRFGRCEELFHTLLALDHQRLAPWGEYHGLNVACYYLQHPSTAPADAAGGQWTLVEAFRDGGLEAVHRLETQRVAQNRMGRFVAEGATGLPERTQPARYTIEDLSVDGSFPAEGCEHRMAQWISSVLAERSA